MEADEPPRRSRGGVRRMSLPEGRRFVIDGMSLVNRASAVAPPPMVQVWAEVGHGGARAIGKLSPEKPIAVVRPVVELNGEFVLRHDSTSSTVRLYAYYIDTPNPEGEGEPTTRSTFALEDIGVEEVL